MGAMTHRFGSWRGFVLAATGGAIAAVALVGWAGVGSNRTTPPPTAAWLLVEPPGPAGTAASDHRS